MKDGISTGPRPYHVVPGPVGEKRILLISYHAPPSNEVGATRWASMARYFAERGWGLDVLAREPTGLKKTSQALLEGLPPGTRLYGIPERMLPLDRLVHGLVHARRRFRSKRLGSQSGAAIEAERDPSPQAPTVVRRLLNAFHAWREVEAERDWARRAAEVGRLVNQPGVHRWVISSGPPHMSHEGGRLLAQWTRLPFAPDFRDPWRFQEWVPLGPTWTRLARRHEARVVAQSTLTVVNVEPVRELMQAAYPTARIVTITNGVDEDPVPTAAASKRFIIGYPGTIYLDRDPAPVFEAVGMMVRELRLTPEDLGLEFMGYFEADVLAHLHHLATAHGLERFLTIHPGSPRPVAHQFMATCSVLVTLQQGGDLMTPAKVFDSMRFPAWLLVLGGLQSATARLLAGTSARVIEPDDIPAIQAMLVACFRERERGHRPAPMATDARFSRRFQAHRLLEAMEAAAPSPLDAPAPTPGDRPKH